MHCDLKRLKKLLLAENAGLVLEAFDRRQRALLARLRKARKTPSEREIHDVRVAIRRMLSALTLVETLLPAGRTRAIRRRLKTRLNKLGAMRDVQALIVLCDELMSDFPQLLAFRRHLAGQERRLTCRVRRDLRLLRPRELRSLTGSLLEALIDALEPDNDRGLGNSLRASIEEAYGRVIKRRARIDPHDTSTIHRMRIAFKKFRYMAEVVAPGYPRFSPERLKAMHDYQDRMGAIQDLETLLGAMMEFRKKSGSSSILVAENEIRRRRQRLIDEFMQTADELRFFWSPPQVDSREVV